MKTAWEHAREAHYERQDDPGWIPYKLSDADLLSGAQRFLDERKHPNDTRDWQVRLVEVLDNPKLLQR